LIQNPSRPSSPPPERILYVDDERAAREAFAGAAHELGYRVDTADGGGEALTKASQNRYAVIATDLRMPTLNGLSLIQLLRPKWPRTSYLIVTGASHLDLPAQHDGSPLVDAVVTKPWTLDGLARILGEAIERYRGRKGDGDESPQDDLPILLITDNTASAESLRRSLGSAFPEARLVVEPSVERGIELLLEAPASFRAVLLDLELTDGGGLGGLHRLRRAEASLPIVALGSLEDESIRERALGAGAQDYLAKPAVNDYVLRQSLRYALDRKRTEEKLLFLARRDPVSGLFNRAVFHERLAQAIERADAATTLAVLLLDVDRFKQVNDSLGHAIGDRLIELVAGRLSENLGERDVVARHGGDEFAVLLEGIPGEEAAAATAQRLLEAFVPPVALKEYEIVVTASIGIALYPDHGETADELLQRADKAMYRAKQNGRDGYQIYSDENEESRSGVLERLRFESGIRHALEQNEYVLYYQPQMTMDRTRLLAVEALVRWRHPKAGLVPPSKFMPFLETTGLIKGVGAWVLENACSEVRSWQQQGFDLRVTVNLSARQFEGTELVSLIGRILDETALPASTLELEITESLLMRDIERTRALLKELKSLGVRIAIDDFGTGYSSLAYLTKFPFDCLKIDRSFVRDIETDADHRAIAQAIIGLGHSLRLDVVAEGVETEPQLDLLRGCDGFQGFLISRPQAAHETRELLERYRSSMGA
jgi:diguanylate cyclase (GGDEF)-like protein